jgi:hypothetical protein
MDDSLLMIPFSRSVLKLREEEAVQESGSFDHMGLKSGVEAGIFYVLSLVLRYHQIDDNEYLSMDCSSIYLVGQFLVEDARLR